MTSGVAAVIDRGRWFLSRVSHVDVLCRKIRGQRWAIHIQLRRVLDATVKVIWRCSCWSRSRWSTTEAGAHFKSSPLAGRGEVAIV